MSAPEMTIHVKRGEDLALDCRVIHLGAPVDISGWQVDCWVRSPDGRLVQPLTFAAVEPAQGKYRLSAASAQTAAWPARALVADIRYRAADGQVRYSGTFALTVQRAETTP